MSARSRPSPALVVACVALVASVTSPAWADPLANSAASIKKTAAKALRLGKKADKSSKKAVKTANEAKATAAKALAKGGPPGPQGAAGANGRDLVLNTPLAGGQTDRGIWAVGGGTSDSMFDAIQFHAPLTAPLDAAHTIRVAGSGPDAGGHCQAPGSAARGYFCLYERVSSATFDSISDPATGVIGVGTLGAQVAYTGSGPTQGAQGTWAVTAP
jgi:hypothetical protein